MSTIIHKRPDLRSNHPSEHIFVVQVKCTGMGWMDTIHGGNSLDWAERRAVALVNDPSRWVCPEAPKSIRIVHRISDI